MPDTTASRHTIVVSALAVSTALDLFELVAASTRKVKIREVRVAQYSDAGDSQAEILPIQLIRGYTTPGSGGSTPTPANVVSGGRAAVASVAAGNTTLASGGSPEVLVADGWNVAAGWLWNPLVDEFIVLAAGESLVVRIPSAPEDELTINATVLFEEEGIVS